jgi:polar amino acid transport system substrate-binding protein
MRTVLLMLALLAGSARGEKTLRWGSDAQGGAPYVFHDPLQPNRLTGFEVELAGLLGQHLGVEMVPVHGPWDTLLQLLNRGDTNLVLNGIEVTDEKRRTVALSRPYLAVSEVLTVRKDSVVSDLKGLRVGSLPGSVAARIAEDRGAEVRTYEGGQDEIYGDLKLGRLDAVLLDEPIAHYYGDLDPELKRVTGDFGSVAYAIAVRHDDPELLAQLNAALSELERSGALRSLYQRWGVWTQASAQLAGASMGETASAPEFERWRQAVGPLPSWKERLTVRYPALLPQLLAGAAMTAVTSVCAMVLAMTLGLVLAFSRRFGPLMLRAAAQVYIEFFRGTPLLIQLTVVYFGLPELGVKLSPWVAGVLALGLNYAAAEAENYRAGLQAVPVGQFEAAEVLGLSTWQTVRYVVGPQATRIAILPMTNDFIALLKDSALVSLVTLTELTKTYTTLANSTRDHLGLGLLVALLYLALGLPFARLARRLEQRLGRHLERGAR